MEETWRFGFSRLETRISFESLSNQSSTVVQKEKDETRAPNRRETNHQVGPFHPVTSTDEIRWRHRAPKNSSNLGTVVKEKHLFRLGLAKALTHRDETSKTTSTLSASFPTSTHSSGADNVAAAAAAASVAFSSAILAIPLRFQNDQVTWNHPLANRMPPDSLRHKTFLPNLSAASGKTSNEPSNDGCKWGCFRVNYPHRLSNFLGQV